MKAIVFVSILSLFLGLAIVNVVGKQATAKAYATTRLADQKAANLAQARQQQARQFDLRQSEREAISPHIIQSRIVLIYTLAGAVGVLAIVVAGSIGYLSFGAAQAGVVAAHTRAKQIPMRPDTMHYPLYIHDNGHKVYLIDLNTGLVVDTEQVRGIDKLLAKNSGATRQLGVQPRETILLNNKESESEKII